MKKVLYLACIAALVSCTKEPGEGGKSAIQGMVEGAEYGDARAEVTDVICMDGSTIEGASGSGPYWLLNVPNGGAGYYIWYFNTALSDPTPHDPGLSGRTGIRVDFVLSHTNVDIAANTLAALQATAWPDVIAEQYGDIVTITHKVAGGVPDATDISSDNEIDVRVQGEGSVVGGIAALPDQDVYIKYGDNVFYDDRVSTDASGFYQFKDLNPGDYTVYALSFDTLTGTTIEQSVQVTIDKQKQIVDAPTLTILAQ